MSMKKIKYFVCDECPCLNSDIENGSDCNLRYTTSLKWVDRKNSEIVEDTPEMRSHQMDFDLKDISMDCSLLKIICKDKIFYPEIITGGEE